MPMRTIIFIALLLLPGLATATQPETTVEQIQAATESFLSDFARQSAAKGYKVRFQPGHLDDRLALATCTDPLTVRFTGDPWKSTRPSLEVSCSGDRPWRMFVTPSVEIEGPALVAARPLTRGERLDASMVSVNTVTVNESRRGVIRTLEMVDGMVVRRPVNAGVILTPDLLEAPDAVSRGDHVIIIARSGQFEVRSRGKALASAAVGEQVLVENLQSSRTIRAQVVAPGRVEIHM